MSPLGFSSSPPPAPTPSRSSPPPTSPSVGQLVGPLAETVSMPMRFPAEFKRDVVAVARRGELTVAEIAINFDVSKESVRP